MEKLEFAENGTVFVAGLVVIPAAACAAVWYFEIGRPRIASSVFGILPVAWYIGHILWDTHHRLKRW